MANCCILIARQIHNISLTNPSVFDDFRVKIGLGQTFNDVMVLGRRYTGPEAVTAQIAQSAVPAPDLIPTAIQLAGQLLVQGPYKRESLKAMKESVYQSFIDFCHQDPRRKSSL